jgi:NodT family efflux transporter outer membrane factor (OMF) lipoprotein
MKPAAIVALCAGVLAACGTVGPDYQRPAVAVPHAYKEQPGWKPVTPRDTAERGPWWQVYQDPVLDALERQVSVSNQNLKASEAAFRQARAAVAQARAGLFPTVNANASGQRSGARGGNGIDLNHFGASLGADWEPDLWGKIRRTVEASAASAQASAADLAGARLSAQAALASNYFELRVQDEQKRLLDATIAAYAKTLAITQNQFDAGYVAQADVITAETTLRTTQAQAIHVGVLRAQLEHAIAVLIGKPPAEFALAPAPLAMQVPAIPAGVPSTLLERNPGIAAAEHTLIAANAQIGISLAAYYPDITLSASYGFASAAVGSLLHGDSALWSVGAQLAQVLFDAGARRARVEQARAAYEQNLALYRQTVLDAFQQVEDQLAALGILEQEAAVRQQAVRLARLAVAQTVNEYEAGTVPYTSVVTAQAAALGNEQAALSVHESRLVASVTLIQTLGGGWSAAQLPLPSQLAAGARH